MVIPDGCFRLVLNGAYAGTSKWVNIYHGIAPSLDVTDPLQLSDLLEDLLGTFDSAGFYDECSDTFAAIDAKLSISDGSAYHDTAAPATDIVGTETGGQNAGGIAAVISWLGGWHYQGGKPRTYMGGLTDNRTASPTLLDATFVGTLRSKANDLIAFWEALDGSYGADVAMGAVIGNSPSSSGVFWPYTGARVTQQVGSQRRRNHG